MSCVNILDNDTTLALPTYGGNQPCVSAQVPTCQSGGFLKSASAAASLSFNPDGTWSVSGSGGGSANCGTTTAAPIGVLASGVWIEGLFDPTGYEIRITGQQRFEYATNPPVGALDNCPNPPNPVGFDPPYDTGWLPLSFGVAISSAAATNCGQVCVISVTAIKTYTVQIRSIANPANVVTASGSLCAIARNSQDGCA